MVDDVHALCSGLHTASSTCRGREWPIYTVHSFAISIYWRKGLKTVLSGRTISVQTFSYLLRYEKYVENYACRLSCFTCMYIHYYYRNRKLYHHTTPILLLSTKWLYKSNTVVTVTMEEVVNNTPLLLILCRLIYYYCVIIVFIVIIDFFIYYY